MGIIFSQKTHPLLPSILSAKAAVEPDHSARLLDIPIGLYFPAPQLSTPFYSTTSNQLQLE